jgi:hypothetical protein
LRKVVDAGKRGFFQRGFFQRGFFQRGFFQRGFFQRGGGSRVSTKQVFVGVFYRK